MHEQASQEGMTFGQRVVSVFPQWVTPNHLTFLRMACALAMLALELHYSGLGVIIILGLIAGFSDLLDGALARARGLVTNLGAFLDPLSDKLFAIVLMVIVWRRDLAEPWLLLLILVTEVHTVVIPVLSLLRRRRQGRDLWPPPKVEPNQLGKLKTFWFANSLGFSIIGAWLGWDWLISFCWFNIWVSLGLGLGGEVIYLRDYARGAYA